MTLTMVSVVLVVSKLKVSCSIMVHRVNCVLRSKYHNTLINEREHNCYIHILVIHSLLICTGMLKPCLPLNCLHSIIYFFKHFHFPLFCCRILTVYTLYLFKSARIIMYSVFSRFSRQDTYEYVLLLLLFLFKYLSMQWICVHSHKARRSSYFRAICTFNRTVTIFSIQSFTFDAHVPFNVVCITLYIVSYLFCENVRPNET